MSEERFVPTAPDENIEGLIAERLGLYRAVVVAALRMPRPLKNGNQAMVDDRRLDSLWDALDRLTDHSEGLETMF